MDDTARNASARRETVCRLELFVDAYAPYRPCVFPVRRVHIDPRERHRRRPPRLTALSEDSYVQVHGRTRVRPDHPQRARQSVRSACRRGGDLRSRHRAAWAHMGRLRRLGASRWREERDVSRPGVLRQRSTPACPATEVLKSSTRSAGAAPAVHPRRVQPPRAAPLIVRNRQTARPTALPSGARQLQ